MIILTDIYRFLFKRLQGKGFGLGIGTKIHEFLWSYLQPTQVNVNGVKLHLPPRDEGVSESLKMEGTWEKEETALFESIVTPGMTVLDVGANVGYYTLLASRLVGPQGKVIAFEPEPLNFELLIRNILENRSANVTAWPYAVGSALGYADLNLSWPASTGSHSIAYQPKGGSSKLRVVLVGLDDFLDPSLWPDVIKMDIEGAEIFALEGMKKILAHKKLKALFVESNPEILRVMGKRAQEITDFLRPYGFNFRQFDKLNILCTRN